MAKQELAITTFIGGMSELEKVGFARFIQNLEILKDTHFITNARTPTKISSTTVTGLPLWFADGSPFDTNRYAYDENGVIYSINSSDTVSLLQTTSNASGNGLAVHDDFLYYALDAELGRYGKLTGTPAFSDSFLSDGTTNVDQTGGGTGATDYSTTTGINEGATHRQTFVPTRDPLKAVIIDVDVVGTGDWTVTVHDANNNSIGSATITNGSMSTGDVTFTFSTPLRVVIGDSYHFHVTTTVANGGVDTSSNNDLEAAEFSTLFGILINATWHPIVTIDDVVAIGNKNYIAYWDQVTYNPNYITLRPGMEVRAMASFDEFVVAAAFMGSTFDQSEFARLYFWDGIQTTINFYTDVTFGAPNAIANDNNNLIGVYGNKGSIKQGNSPFQTVRSAIPKLAEGSKVEVYPGAVTEYEDELLIGYAGVTDDSSFEQGVYSLGSIYNDETVSLSQPYTISTGTTTGTTVKIGAVKSFGEDLLIGWRDASSYGIDKITAGDNYAASGKWESIIFDADNPRKNKLAHKLVITFEALASGETVTPKYDINRSGSFTTGNAAGSGDTSITQLINTRFKEIAFGFNFTSSSNTQIKITGITLYYDDLKEEVTL